jgi:GNAT superfamily N-acetyltransferase
MIKITKYSKLSDILEFVPIFREKYANLSAEEIEYYLSITVKTSKYRLLIAQNENEEVIGMAAFHIGAMLYCGKYIQVSSLFVRDNSRNQGVAQLLMGNIEMEGKAKNCDNIVLDSFTNNITSHEFYQKLGFEKKTIHFMKKL